MASNCFTPIKAKVLRSTRLDSCGAHVVGARSSVVSTGFASAQGSRQVQAGAEFTKVTANGDLCVNQKDNDRLKWVNVTMAFCSVDPDIVEIMAGLRLLTSAVSPPATGSSIGYAEDSSPVDGHFALEFWQPLAGDVCAGGSVLYLYTVFPHLTNGAIGDLAFQYGPVDFTIKAETRGAPSTWGNGPYEANLLNISTDEHWAQYLTAVVPPTAACGAVALA